MKALIACTAVAAASAALAQPDVPRSDAVHARESPERVICELRPEPGSRVHRRRVCMTEATWKVYRRESRHFTERIQDRRSR